MNRHAPYPYPAQMAAPTPHRYGTSSAFSASANPNEDWTKISDLAERRRIQNRIAQRNYRKKLKKRLEDLERRAASNSASPEQKPAELAQPAREDAHSKSSSPRKSSVRRHTPEVSQGSYYSSQDDRGSMFTHQYTRQLSTSPPPFSYSTYSSAEPTAYSYAQTSPNYGWASTSAEMPSYQQTYLPPLTSTYSLPSHEPPMKQQNNYYGDEEVSPFSMSYASMAGIDVPQQHHYQDSKIHTPPLSESFDHSTAGSPPEFSAHYPATPASMPGTPPLHLM